ncbi:MAG: hypothetical protein E6J40_15250 [Chloroflexi bacterium]|nr:MAG: hypothetical protein E6J40_15250 [Chloroflexota bacterium]
MAQASCRVRGVDCLSCLGIDATQAFPLFGWHLGNEGGDHSPWVVLTADNLTRHPSHARHAQVELVSEAEGCLCGAGLGSEPVRKIFGSLLQPIEKRSLESKYGQHYPAQEIQHGAND